MRDRAIVTLLLRTGQRIGDWSEEHGRHGVLGMRLSDADRRRRTVTVLLKGARDEHRVPVTPDWWSLLDDYVSQERGTPDTPALWVGRRPPVALPGLRGIVPGDREADGRACHRAHVPAHGRAAARRRRGVHVAQEVLGYRYISTTVEEYASVDEKAMMTALTEVGRRQRRSVLAVVQPAPRFAFPYSADTISALEELTGGGAR